jgi:predicted enzyme related to lactoylglutathione lyase
MSRLRAGSAWGMQLTVTDAHAAQAELAGRGVQVSELTEFPCGSFVFFEDLSGNR